jgi:hypothetical protein
MCDIKNTNFSLKTTEFNQKKMMMQMPACLTIILSAFQLLLPFTQKTFQKHTKIALSCETFRGNLHEILL